MHPALRHIFHGFNDLLFPDKCLKCGKYIEINRRDSLQDHFCPECARAGVAEIEFPLCALCGLPLPKLSDAGVCESCLKNPLLLGKIRAAAEYKGLLKETIHLFKYQSKLSIAKALEKMMQAVYVSHFADVNYDILMPVPLHPERLRQRGFNQAYILVRNLEKSIRKSGRPAPEWQISTRALIRIKRTAFQTGFDVTQRRQNLKNAFQVKDKKTIENKRILLVDDVLTTGATCNEAAKELLKNGVRQVDAMVLARA